MAEVARKQVVIDDVTLEIVFEGGVLPFQIEGWVTYVDAQTQETAWLAFYARERDGWSLDIAPPGMTIRQLWAENQAHRQRGERERGYIHPDLDLEDMYALIARHARRYRATLEQERQEQSAQE